MDEKLLKQIEKSLEEEEEKAEPVVKRKTNAQTNPKMSAVFTDFERNNTAWMVKVKKQKTKEKELY